MTTRVLHIAPTFMETGTPSQPASLAAGLPRDEFEVHVCEVGAGKLVDSALGHATVPVTCIDKRWRRDPVAYWKLRRHIHRLRPDLVHTWSFMAGAYGRAAAMAESVPRIVHTVQHIDLAKPRWQWWIDRHLARRTTHLVGNSSGVRDYHLANAIPAERFCVIPDGIRSHDESEVTHSELVQSLQLPADARLIGVVGSMETRERVKELIWTVELVAVLHSSVHLLIFGEGPYRESLEEYARLASSLDRVRFLEGRDKLARILSHVDVVWQAYSTEGMPRAILEAMAAGVPVVATDSPGSRALVQPGETGYLVPSGSRAERARATDLILANRPLAARLGEAARIRASKSFGIDHMVTAYARLYGTEGHAAIHFQCR